MALDKNSNGYTFGFAFVLVVVVGSILAIAALALKEPQAENIKKEKMKNILAAIQVEATLDNAEELFFQYVKTRVVINAQGDKLNTAEGAVQALDKQDAFNVDVLKEYKTIDAVADRNFPLFVCEKEGATYYVIPLVGKGLWGPIWGFVALENDYNTVYGASFDHKGETPGLGAEISTAAFQKQFEGKKILDNGNFVSVRVLKTGAGDAHSVDAISGGTITSVGVDEMVQRTLAIYNNYFKING